MAEWHCGCKSGKNNDWGTTNSRIALPGTIRGDYSMSMQENIIHASDSLKTTEVEIKKFFDEKELFVYSPTLLPCLYANDEQ